MRDALTDVNPRETRVSSQNPTSELLIVKQTCEPPHYGASTTIY